MKWIENFCILCQDLNLFIITKIQLNRWIQSGIIMFVIFSSNDLLFRIIKILLSYLMYNWEKNKSFGNPWSIQILGRKLIKFILRAWTWKEAKSHIRNKLSLPLSNGLWKQFTLTYLCEQRTTSLTTFIQTKSTFLGPTKWVSIDETKRCFYPTFFASLTSKMSFFCNGAIDRKIVLPKFM